MLLYQAALPLSTRRAGTWLATVEEADLALVDQRVLDGRILLAEYAPTGKSIPH